MTNTTNNFENDDAHSFNPSKENTHSSKSHSKDLHHILKLISEELCKLKQQSKAEFDWFKSHNFATKHDLKEMKDTIMSKISEFAAAQGAFNDRMDVAVAGLAGDVKHLNDLIEELQGTPGEISPEDQALLDQIQVRAQEIVAKLEALDALTAPVTGSNPTGSV